MFDYICFYLFFSFFINKNIDFRKSLKIKNMKGLVKITKDKNNKKILILIISFLALLLMIFGISGFYKSDKYYEDNFAPYHNNKIIKLIVTKEKNNKIIFEKKSKKDDEKTIVVGKNFNIEQLSELLHKEKIIKNPEIFIDKYIQFISSNNIQPGGYVFKGNEDLSRNNKNITDGPTNEEYKKSYFNSIKDEAKKLGQEYNILPSQIMAHSALESQFGCSELAYKYNNYFGIKSNDKVSSVVLPTKEYVNGRYITIKDRFFAPKDVYQSLESYCKTLNKGNEWNKKQFKDVVGEKDYKKAAKGLVKDGYATDPELDDNIIYLTEEFNLNQFN